MAAMPEAERPFSVCVYCGSREGTDPAHAAAARALGRALGGRGWQLVYGGARIGLMGQVADATLAAGGRAVGVIPRGLMAREVGHAGLDELLVVETMHQRKQAMAERADAFVALPGGIGTFEELFEAWTWRQLGYHDRPLGLLNVGSYYDALLGFLHRSVEAGFFSADTLAMLEVATDPVELLDRLAVQARRSRGDEDYSRV